MRRVLLYTLLCLSFAAAGAAQTGSHATRTSKKDRQTPSANAVRVRIDVNSADEKQLEALPGVGPATARKIIKKRPYTSVDDLARAGVAKATIRKIQPYVTVGPASQPAPAPTTGTRGSSAPAPSTSAPQATPRTTPRATESTPPPSGSGMVWVNLDTKVYHREGDRWYGKTKHGKYMTEADAVAAGYRAAKNGGKR